MRRLCIIIVIPLFLILNSNLISQESSETGKNDDPINRINKMLADASNLIFEGNFAVPDSPAFNLLDDYPSKILRPSDVEELVVGLSNFGETDNGILPKSFAVEFSPALLIFGKSLSLRDYQQHPWLYRTRISVAVHKAENESKVTKAAFGIRFSLIDSTDLRTDKTLMKRITKFTERINDIYAKARRREGPGLSLSELIEKFDEEEKQQIKNIENEIASLISNSKKMSDLKKEEADIKWNNKILEFALAASASSTESDDEGLRLDKISGWGTYGLPIKEWGQFLIGVHFSSERELDQTDGGFFTLGSLTTRFYMGRNRYKFYFEGQVLFKEKKKSDLLFSLGSEANLFANAWIVLAIGVEHIGHTKKTGLVTSIRFKHGF